MRLCSVAGCERKHRAKGLCDVHYARRFRTGNVESAHRSGCAVEGCGEKHKAKGFCPRHYRAFMLYGDPLISKHRERCSLCPAKHYARGFCYDHWNIWRSLMRDAEPKPHRLPIAPLKPHLTRVVERYGWRCAAERLSVNRGELHHLLNRNRFVDLDTADRICLALGLPFDAMFNHSDGVGVATGDTESIGSVRFSEVSA